MLRNLNKRRRLVIHHTHLLGKRIVDFLRADDIVFFDDCLFSQYIFLKENKNFFKKLSIDCILGFSSGLYAHENAKQIYDIESHILHDKCNTNILCIDDADRLRFSLEEMNGFMKVSQIKELLNESFCHLAFHGCCHLKLQNYKKKTSLLETMQIFKTDTDSGIFRLQELGFNQPKIFVYPYIYSLPFLNSYLKKIGFTTIVGSQENQIFRISIESLLTNNTSYES